MHPLSETLGKVQARWFNLSSHIFLGDDAVCALVIWIWMQDEGRFNMLDILCVECVH